MRKILFFLLLLPLFTGCDKENEKEKFVKEFTFEFEDETFDGLPVVLYVSGDNKYEPINSKVSTTIDGRFLNFSVEYIEKIVVTEENFEQDKYFDVYFEYFGISTKCSRIYQFSDTKSPDKIVIYKKDYKQDLFYVLKDNNIVI